MRSMGTTLQVLAVLIAVGGVVLGLFAMMLPTYTSYGTYTSGSNVGTGFGLLVSSLILAVLFNAAGVALHGLADITIATQRSADANVRAAEALEALTRRQRVTAAPEQHMEERSPVIRPLQTDAPASAQSNTAKVLRQMRSATDQKPPES